MQQDSKRCCNMTPPRLGFSKLRQMRCWVMADLYVAFSDGVTEATNGGAEFGDARLLAFSRLPDTNRLHRFLICCSRHCVSSAPGPDRQFVCSAFVGSTDAARNAGTRQAIIATTKRPAVTSPNVTGSCGLTLNSWVASTRAWLRTRHARDDADRDGPCGLFHDQHHHVAPRRAKRQADADLLRASRDEVGDHAVDANRRQRAPIAPSSGQQQRVEPRSRQRFAAAAAPSSAR